MHWETQFSQLDVPPFLKRFKHTAGWALQLDEQYSSPRQQHQSVRYATHTKRIQLDAQPLKQLDALAQVRFNRVFGIEAISLSCSVHR